MPDPSPTNEQGAAPPASRTGGTGVVVAALLVVGIVVPLLVPIYDTEDPRLFGFPFYYWFQFLLIPIVSVMTYVAFRLSLRSTAKEREAVGLPPYVDEDGERR